jgi:hypothetical protein
MPHQNLLSAHLWALRSEVESQIRNMSSAHQRVDALPPVTAPQYIQCLEEIVQDLERILDANKTVRALSENALEEARRVMRLQNTSGTGK